MKDINLLPKDLQDANLNDEEDKKITVKGVIIVLSCIAILTVIFSIPQLYANTLDIQLSGINEKINDARFDDIKSINASIILSQGLVDKKKATLNSIDTEIYTVNEVFKSMQNVAPTGSVITSLEFSGKTVDISGVLKTQMQWAELLSRVSRVSIIDSDIEQTVPFTNLDFSLSFNITGK